MRAVVRAVRVQLEDDGLLSNVDAFAAGPVPSEEWDELFVDDVNGGYLDADLVRAARNEELQWCDRRQPL